MKKLIWVLIFISFNISYAFDRIIATAPSSTEIILDLGLGEKLIAVDKESAKVDGLPKNVKIMDFRNTDTEQLLMLDPDIIIASTYNLKKGENPFEILEKSGVSIQVVPTAQSISEIETNIEKISKIFNVEKKGAELKSRFRDEINSIKIGSSKNFAKKTVYFEINPAPYIYTFGGNTYLNEMIEISGGKNIFSDGTGWINASKEAILTKNPEVIFYSNMEGRKDSLVGRDEIDGTEAAKKSQIFPIDQSALKPTHRLTKALKEMAEYLKN